MNMARIVEKISFKALAETMLFEVLSPPKPNMRAIFEIMTSPHNVLCYVHNFWIILKLFPKKYISYLGFLKNMYVFQIEVFL